METRSINWRGTSCKAFKLLQECGHEPIPVHPHLESLEGKKVFHDLKDVGSVDTLTVYVGATLSTKFKDSILNLDTKRVIFNPGAENPELAKALEEKGVEVENACTLVLLRTNQF